MNTSFRIPVAYENDVVAYFHFLAAQCIRIPVWLETPAVSHDEMTDMDEIFLFNFQDVNPVATLWILGEKINYFHLYP